MRPDELTGARSEAGKEEIGVMPGHGAAASLASRSIRLRVAFLVVAAGVLAIGLFMLISALRQSPDPEEFIGTVMDPPIPALDFSLSNQRAEQVSLSDLRGKPVVLTFLYTSCTDVCPFVGIKLKQLVQALGDEADRVEIIAISTDPERDTPERIADYSRTLDMFDRWNYLIGEKDELSPIWDAYFIGQPIVSDESVFATREDLDFFGLTTGLSEGEIGEANIARGRFGGGYDVSHVTPIWLIDGNGEIRVKLDTAGPPEDYVKDIRLLLEESR